MTNLYKVNKMSIDSIFIFNKIMYNIPYIHQIKKTRIR